MQDGDIVHVHTNNGSEFHKHFESELLNLNLSHWWSRPKTPKDNPRNERFNRTLKEEFLRFGNYNPDIQTFNVRLTDWLVEYNAVRPHQSLGYRTPIAFAEECGGGCPRCGHLVHELDRFFRCARLPIRKAYKEFLSSFKEVLS